jgi:hypothetical protein
MVEWLEELHIITWAYIILKPLNILILGSYLATHGSGHSLDQSMLVQLRAMLFEYVSISND